MGSDMFCDSCIAWQKEMRDENLQFELILFVMLIYPSTFSYPAKGIIRPAMSGKPETITGCSRSFKFQGHESSEAISKQLDVWLIRTELSILACDSLASFFPMHKCTSSHFIFR
jgi:hypothetical protein